MIKILSLLLIIFSIHCRLNSEPPPVSCAFMIADLKHNEEEGIKICELQSGAFSSFTGYDWLSKNPGAVPRSFVSILNQFNHSIWVLERSLTEKAIKKELILQKIPILPDINAITSDPEFIESSCRPVDDPNDLESYHTLLIANPYLFGGTVEEFHSMYPHVIVIDQVCYPYWYDKLKMTEMLSEDPLLEEIQPKWKVFERTMSNKGIEESLLYFSTDHVVIKPRHAQKGNGIIIVEREKLPDVLDLICHHRQALCSHSEKEYRYWGTHLEKQMIVEEFHYSDPVTAPHLGNKEYDPTLRIAFMIWHEHGKTWLDFVELHWKLPTKSLSEQGSFKEKHKSNESKPYYAFVEPERGEAIKQQLRESIPLLYEKMMRTEK